MVETKGRVRAFDDALSLPEAAAIIGVSRQTAWIYVLAGRLPAKQLGGRYLVHRADAERVREENAKQSHAAPAAVA